MRGSWAFFFLFGHMRDLVRKRLPKAAQKVGEQATHGFDGCKRLPATGRKALVCCFAQGYAPIRQDYEDFYTRRMFYRIHVRLKLLHRRSACARLCATAQISSTAAALATPRALLLMPGQGMAA